MDSFASIPLTSEERGMIDNIQFDLPDMVEVHEVFPVLLACVEQFKNKKEQITEENIGSLVYIFRRMLNHIREVRAEGALIEMLLDGDLLADLNEDDEWVWSLSFRNKETGNS